MKKCLHTLAALLLAAVLLAGCAPQTAAPGPVSAPVAEPEAEAPAAMIANPLHEVDSYEALLAASQDVLLADAPAGASDAAYCWIEGDPRIAQITFTYAENDYTYRAASCAAPDAMVDISGVYNELPQKDELQSEGTATDGGAYTLQYGGAEPLGLATWYYAPSRCQYSLFTTTGCDEYKMIEEVVDLLLPLKTDSTGNELPMPGETLAVPAEAGKCTGVVAEINDNDVVVNLENGSTLVFLLTYIENVEAKAGDTVEIAYGGDLAVAPEALSVTVTASAAAAPVVNGEVSQLGDANLYVKTATGNVFGFTLDAGTRYAGVAKTPSLGATVRVSYEGDLTNLPAAKKIEILAVPEAPISADTALQNKTLTGDVRELTSKSVSIHTDAGHLYKFKRDKTTRVSGGYALQTGATVKVTYDGYASKAPLAKAVLVVAPPDPTPPKPTPSAPPAVHTAAGTITVHAGNALSIVADNGRSYSFLLGAPEITGDTWGYVGDYATVTYYSEGGSNVVTHVRYQSAYRPVPAPTVAPEPICTVRTITGMVTMCAGNALSVETDGGRTYSFLLGAPEITGNSYGEVGDRAQVTFQDCGGVTDVLRVHFTALAPLLVTSEDPLEDGGLGLGY